MIVFTPVAIVLFVLVALAETRPSRVTSPRWANDPEARAPREAWAAYPKSVVVDLQRGRERARFETASSLFSPCVCGAWRTER